MPKLTRRSHSDNQLKNAVNELKNNKHKLSLSKRRSYSDDQLKNAVNELKNNKNNLPLSKIANKYGIPRTSLRLYYFKSPEIKKKYSALQSALTKSEEESTKEWLIDSANRGFYVNKHELLDSVQNIITENQRPHPFQSNRPDKSWLNDFMERHSEVKLFTKAEQASLCAERHVSLWYNRIRQYAKAKSFFSCFDVPHKVFIANECKFEICKKTRRILTNTDLIPVRTNEYASILLTFSAAGESITPFINLPQDNYLEKMVKAMPNGWAVAKSHKGLITSELFYDYVSNLFVPYLTLEGIESPVILFVNEQNTYLSYKLHQLCCEKKIEILPLHQNVIKNIKSELGLEETFKKEKSLKLGAFARELVKFLSNLPKTVYLNIFYKSGLSPFNIDTLVGNEIPDSTIITYAEFKSIVGDSTIANFNNPLLEDSEHLSDLHKLWIAFRNKSKQHLAYFDGDSPEKIESANDIKPLDQKQELNKENNEDVKLCKICSDVILPNSMLKCVDCENVYHKACVPKLQTFSLPDIPDAEFHLCHLCMDDS